MNRDIIRAVYFAADKHRDQRRKDMAETPYINHPIALADLLANECNIDDTVIIQTALLHDTIEDTDTSYEELSWEFGPEVANIVEELSDDKELDKFVRKQLQIDHAAESSYRAKIVKLADKIINLRDLVIELPKGWTEERRLDYFDWAKDVVDELRGTNENLEMLFDDIHELGMDVYG